MKSYTDLEQSRKLAEILPIESADMCLTFVNNKWNPVWGKADNIYQLQKDCYEPDYTKDDYVDIDEFEPKVVSCWSLASLLEQLEGRNFVKLEIKYDDGQYYIFYVDDRDSIDMKTKHYNNLIDACVEMIIKLKENNIL